MEVPPKLVRIVIDDRLIQNTVVLADQPIRQVVFIADRCRSLCDLRDVADFIVLVGIRSVAAVLVRRNKRGRFVCSVTGNVGQRRYIIAV